MAETSYPFTIDPADVEPGKLLDEVRASAISLEATKVTTVDSTVNVWFPDPLSGGDQTELGFVVGRHAPTPPEDQASSDAGGVLDAAVLHVDGTFVIDDDGSVMTEV